MLIDARFLREYFLRHLVRLQFRCAAKARSAPLTLFMAGRRRRATLAERYATEDIEMRRHGQP